MRARAVRTARMHVHRAECAADTSARGRRWPCAARPTRRCLADGIARQTEGVMIKVYGVPQSRAFRVLWALRELGLEFEKIDRHTRPVPTSIAGGTRSAEFLKLNPNGHIPVLVDGTTVLWESMAINLYLARQYGAGTLWPASVPDEGR